MRIKGLDVVERGRHGGKKGRKGFSASYGVPVPHYRSVGMVVGAKRCSGIIERRIEAVDEVPSGIGCDLDCWGVFACSHLKQIT